MNGARLTLFKNQQQFRLLPVHLLRQHQLLNQQFGQLLLRNPQRTQYLHLQLLLCSRLFRCLPEDLPWRISKFHLLTALSSSTEPQGLGPAGLQSLARKPASASRLAVRLAHLPRASITLRCTPATPGWALAPGFNDIPQPCHLASCRPSLSR